MTRIFERAASALLTLSAIVIAGSVIHREFFPSPASSGPVLRQVQNAHELSQAGRVIGDPAAPIQLVEFFDAQCPGCKQVEAVLKRLDQHFPGKIARTYVHYPIPIHDRAYQAARVVECGGRQGAFARVVDALYARQDSLGIRPWTAYADDAGIPDRKAFAECARDTMKVLAVEKGIAAVERYGITGTPTIIVNGWRVEGAPTDSVLTHTVEDLLGGKRPRLAASRW